MSAMATSILRSRRIPAPLSLYHCVSVRAHPVEYASYFTRIVFVSSSRRKLL
jgi:hypothetical protein